MAIGSSSGGGSTESPKVRVLVADDDPIQRDLLQTALSGWGYEVVCVNDGMRAWELLQGESQFSVLITDWVMPELDGVALCRKLKKEQRDPYLPVILITSREGSEDMVEALDSGADAFLKKPFNSGQLLAQIQVAERTLKLEERLAEQLRELRVANERLLSGLAAAAAVQSSLLPEVSPMIHGVDFEWSYEACESLGGDMFNIFRLDERRVGMYVLDVSGHGPSAALQSVTLRGVRSNPASCSKQINHLHDLPQYWICGWRRPSAGQRRRQDPAGRRGRFHHPAARGRRCRTSGSRCGDRAAGTPI